MMKELSFSSLAAVIPSKPGVFGANINYFGFSKYHDTKIGIAYSHKLGQKLAASVQLDYFSSFIFGAENNLRKITFELGIISIPAENLMVGFHLFNPIPGKGGHNIKAYLPSITRLGISYFLREKVMLSIETFKEFSEKIIVKTGMEYTPVKKFAIRFGVSTEPASYSFGLGYYFNKIRAGLAFANHQTLGFTPRLDFGIEF
jgi:hypothetical protein